MDRRKYSQHGIKPTEINRISANLCERLTLYLSSSALSTTMWSSARRARISLRTETTSGLCSRAQYPLHVACIIVAALWSAKYKYM